MIVRPDPTILNFSGKFPRSNLILMSRANRRITYARYYLKPDVDVSDFTSKIKAIGLTWSNSSYRFKENVYKYAQKWNEIYTSENDIPVSGYSLFIKACFAMSNLFEFDLSTLTINTFSELVYGDGSQGKVTNTFKDFFLWENVIPVFSDEQLGIYHWFRIDETSIPIYQTLHDIGSQISNIINLFWQNNIDNFIFYNYDQMGEKFYDQYLYLTFGILYPLQAVGAVYHDDTGILNFSWSADIGDNGSPEDTVYCYLYTIDTKQLSLLEGSYKRDSGSNHVNIGTGLNNANLRFLPFAFMNSIVSTSNNVLVSSPFI